MCRYHAWSWRKSNTFPFFFYIEKVWGIFLPDLKWNPGRLVSFWWGWLEFVWVSSLWESTDCPRPSSFTTASSRLLCPVLGKRCFPLWPTEGPWIICLILFYVHDVLSDGNHWWISFLSIYTVWQKNKHDLMLESVLIIKKPYLYYILL